MDHVGEGVKTAGGRLEFGGGRGGDRRVIRGDGCHRGGGQPEEGKPYYSLGDHRVPQQVWCLGKGGFTV